MRRALVHARRARGRGACMAEAVIYDAGLPHPPPPTPWYPPLPVKWVVVLLALLLSPSGLVWPRPVPPCGVGTVVFLVGPAPPLGTSVFYRGTVWMLPLVST